MSTRFTEDARRARWTFGVLAIGVLAALALAAWRPSDRPAEPVSAAAGAAQTSVDAPSPLALPDEPRVLIFGDSWTYGSAASDPSLGYAHVVGGTLGWDTVVDGVRGSGYLKPGWDGGSFGERIATLDPGLDPDPDLVIVQGSINDRRLPADGYRAAVEAAWDELAAAYPDATIVILGPAPQVLPVETATARIDVDLAALAAARGWWYLSPIEGDWITEENYSSVIDTSDVGGDHPSTEGHAYLAELLAASLADLSAPADVVAEAPADLPG